MVTLTEMLDWVQNKASSLGADSYDAIASEGTEAQARFSNNSLTILNEIRSHDVSLYLTKGKKRVLGSISGAKKEVIESLVEKLYRSMVNGAADAEFAPLPSGPFSYAPNGDVDQDGANYDPSSFALRAIDSASSAGASRVAGSLSRTFSDMLLRTSAGVEGTDKRTAYTLNLRAFTDRDASGHGIAVATKLASFDVEAAGRTAGERASMCRSPKQVDEGKYTVLFGRTVWSNLVEAVGTSASAFEIEAGLSFIPTELSSQVANEKFGLIDHGQVKDGVFSRSFDDEGIPTMDTTIIQDGVLKSHLHNSTTAAKWKATSTGSAGLIDPHPWNLEVKAGDSTVEEMVRETKRGIYVTNNWYTRYQSMKTGDYSTLPRDYAFLIEDGELKHPVAGFRISDAIPRQMKAIRLVGRDRSWVKWWEVHFPIYCPDVLIDEVSVTRAAT